MTDLGPFKIRTRDRYTGSPKEGMRGAWTEEQVVEGRRVVARFDLRHQAEAWIARELKRRAGQ